MKQSRRSLNSEVRLGEAKFNHQISHTFSLSHKFHSLTLHHSHIPHPTMTPRLPHPRLLNHPLLLRLSRPTTPVSFRAHPFPRQPSTRTLSTLPPPPKTHSTASKLGLVLGITSLLYLTNDSNELLTEFPIAWYEFSANVLSSLASKVVVFCEDEKSSENGVSFYLIIEWYDYGINAFNN